MQGMRSASSESSTGPPATDRSRERVWGWRSVKRSLRRTAEASASARRPAARSFGLRCRSLRKVTRPPMLRTDPGTQGRVLVVDDDPQIQRMLRSQLSARGYEVWSSGDGQEALLAVADWKPDLVLLDLTMPGMDGIEVCRQLREWAAAPIIL